MYVHTPPKPPFTRRIVTIRHILCLVWRLVYYILRSHGPGATTGSSPRSVADTPAIAGDNGGAPIPSRASTAARRRAASHARRGVARRFADLRVHALERDRHERARP